MEEMAKNRMGIGKNIDCKTLQRYNPSSTEKEKSLVSLVKSKASEALKVLG
jgi:hypothetical protein